MFRVGQILPQILPPLVICQDFHSSLPDVDLDSAPHHHLGEVLDGRRQVQTAARLLVGVLEVDDDADEPVAGESLLAWGEAGVPEMLPLAGENFVKY